MVVVVWVSVFFWFSCFGYSGLGVGLFFKYIFGFKVFFVIS